MANKHKKLHPAGIVSLLLSGVAIALIYLGYPIIATGLGAAAMLTSIPNMFKLLGYKMLISILAGAVTAFAIEQTRVGIPFLGICTLLGTIHLCARLALVYIVFPSPRSYSWYDTGMVIATAGTYLAGNILAPSAWYHWAFGLIPVLLSLLMFLVSNSENDLVNKILKEGYKIQVGSPAPDFELINEQGEPVRLSNFKDIRHVLLVFYRGDWCPFCQISLRTYARNSKLFQDKNILLLAIGPDSPEANRQLVEGLGLDYHILSDSNLEVVKTFGINMPASPRNPPQAKNGYPLPASFLVDKDGVLRYSSHPIDVGEYLNPALIFPILEKLEK